MRSHRSAGGAGVSTSTLGKCGAGVPLANPLPRRRSLGYALRPGRSETLIIINALARRGGRQNSGLVFPRSREFSPPERQAERQHGVQVVRSADPKFTAGARPTSPTVSVPANRAIVRLVQARRSASETRGTESETNGS